MTRRIAQIADFRVSRLETGEISRIAFAVRLLLPAAEDPSDARTKRVSPPVGVFSRPSTTLLSDTYLLSNRFVED